MHNGVYDMPLVGLLWEGMGMFIAERVRYHLEALLWNKTLLIVLNCPLLLGMHAENLPEISRWLS